MAKLAKLKQKTKDPIPDPFSIKIIIIYLCDYDSANNVAQSAMYSM